MVTYAYRLGVVAYTLGLGIGTNPFDRELELKEHEDWLDGWSSKTTPTLEDSLKESFVNIFSDKPIEELRKLDWLSLNPDFHINKGVKNE